MSRVSMANDSLRAVRPMEPKIKFGDLRHALEHTTMFAMHIDALDTLSSSQIDRDKLDRHKRENAEKGVQQNEVLVVRIDRGISRADFEKAARTIYKVRDKSVDPSPQKLDHLWKRGYLVVREQQAIDVIRKMAPGAIIGSGGPSGPAIG